jgi:uncharacterized membrane protein YjfL (UPF0719 family)
VQLVIFWISSAVLGGASKMIETNTLAAAIFLAFMAVAGGLLNAASMTYTT